MARDTIKNMSLINNNKTGFKIKDKRSTVTIGFVFGLVSVVGGLILGLGGPIAGIGLILALLAAIIVLRDIKFGFYGIIIVVGLLPFGTIPVDIGVTPTLLDLALAATIGVWLFRIVTSPNKEFTVSPVTIPLVIFIIVTLFAFIFGMGNGPLTSNLLRHFAELMLSLGFVLVVIDYFSTWRRLEEVVQVIVIVGGLAAAVSIFLWILPDLLANDILSSLQRLGYPGGFVIRYIEENPELAERAIGTSVDPNSLGGLLSIIGAIIGPQVLARKPIFPKWVISLAFILVCVAIYLTFSRGAMVGLIAGFAFVAVIRYRRVVPFILLALALLIVLPFTQDYIARFVEGVQGQDLATQMRFGEYRDAISLIARYPLFGVGFSGSPDIDLYLGVASVYLTIGQQMGLLGLIAFFVLIGAAFAYAYLYRGIFKKRERLDPLWLGLHAGLVSGLVVGIFDHYLFNIDFHHAVTVFWMLFGLAVAATHVAVRKEEEVVLDGQ